MSNVLALAPVLNSLHYSVEQKLTLARAALKLYLKKVIPDVTQMEEEQENFVWADCEPTELKLRTGNVAHARYQYLFEVGGREVFVDILRGTDPSRPTEKDLLVGIVLISEGNEHQALSNLDFADALLCAAKLKLNN